MPLAATLHSPVFHQVEVLLALMRGLDFSHLRGTVMAFLTRHSLAICPCVSVPATSRLRSRPRKWMSSGVVVGPV